MTNPTNTDLAQALRKLHQRWLDLSTACISPSYVLEECASEVEAILVLHDTARAQPAPSVADYFDKLRRDDNHHLGLGDVRLTLGQQEDVVQMAARAQPASVAADLAEALLLFKRAGSGNSTDFVRQYQAHVAANRALSKYEAAPQPQAPAQEVE